MAHSSLQLVSVSPVRAGTRLPGRLLAPLEDRIGRLAMARLYSMVDQGASGLGNIIALAIFGRALPVSQFGIIGMMIGLHYFVAGFHRSAVVLPFLTVHQDQPVGASARAENAAWWWLSIAAALVLSGVLALAGLALNLWAPLGSRAGWIAEPLMLASALTPVMLAAEFGRRWLFKIERADLVALIALVSFVVLVATALVAMRIRPDAATGTVALAMASLCPTVLAFWILRPTSVRWQDMARIIREHRTEAGWLAWANFPYAIYGSATIVILIGFIVGPVAAGVFTAVRTLTNPAMSIVSAIDSTDKPRATRALAEQGLAGLRSAIRRTRWLIIATTGAYLGAIALWASPAATLVFHGQYPDVGLELRLLALAFFLAGLNQPSETALIVLKAGRVMLVVRTVTAGLALVALWLAAPWGVAGMATAIGMVQALNFLLLCSAERHVLFKASRR